jgi:hypothetical protein
MKSPIPSDWNGEDWLCLQLQWPDSPEWVGLLNGILTLLTRGRYWDERTGTITEVQQIAREIFHRAYPYVPCAEQPSDNGNGDGSPPQQSGGYSTDESEDEMPGVTWLEIEDGVLYMYFGPCCKIAVPGEYGSIVTPPPEGEDTDPDEPPTWACNKAAGIASALIDLAVDVRDAISGAGSVYDMYAPAHAVLSPHNSIWATTQQVCWAYVADTSGIDELLADSDTPLWIACTLAASFVQTDTISPDEYWTMQVANYPGFSDEQKLFVSTMVRAVGIQTCQWWARLFHDQAATCECPGQYEGAFKFTGAFSATTPAQIEVVVGNNGKHVDVTWNAPSNNWVDNTEFKLYMEGGSGLDQVKNRVTPLDGSTMPTHNWVEVVNCPELSPNNWSRWQIGPSSGRTEDLVPISGGYENECYWGTPANVTQMDTDVRKCGGSGSSGAVTYKFRVEIIEVDYVPI